MIEIDSSPTPPPQKKNLAYGHALKQKWSIITSNKQKTLQKMLKISFSAISMLVRENGSNKERSFDKCGFFAAKIPDPYSKD